MKLSQKIFLAIIIVLYIFLMLILIAYVSNIKNLETLPNKPVKRTILLDKKKEAIIKAIFTLQGCGFFPDLEEDITIDRKGYDAYIEDHSDFIIYTFNWGTYEKHLTVMKKNVTLD